MIKGDAFGTSILLRVGGKAPTPRIVRGAVRIAKAIPPANDRSETRRRTMRAVIACGGEADAQNECD